jgi:hypothetical protein
MRCDEAREMIAASQSRFLGAIGPDSTGLRDEVDSHTARCADCRALLEDTIWKRFWKRPGPLALWRTRKMVQWLHHKAESAPHPDLTPINRVAITIIQQAIREGASEVEMRMVATADVDRFSSPTNHGGESAGEEPGRDLKDLMRQDLANVETWKWEQKLVVLVRALIGGQWKTQLVMPTYLAPPLWARFKSMANVRVSDQTIPQQGHVDIQYEGNEYDAEVSTAPGDVIETVLIRIQAKAALAA